MDEITVKLDWLRVSFSSDSVPGMVSLLSQYFGQPSEMERGFWGYRSGIEFEKGAKLLCSLPDAENSQSGLPHATVELSGAALGAIGEAVYGLVMSLRLFAVRCRRIDIAADDYLKLITPTDLELNYCQGGKFAPFKTCSFMRGKSMDGVSNTTVYFGRRGSVGSGLQLVCYDKQAESGGVIDAIRWEARFSDDKADKLWFSFVGGQDPDGHWCGEVESYQKLLQHLGGYVGGAVQFFEDVDRTIPAPFWERIRACLRRSKNQSRT